MFEIPEGVTHVQIPLDLFQELVEEANVGYHGFTEDTNLRERILYVGLPD